MVECGGADRHAMGNSIAQDMQQVGPYSRVVAFRLGRKCPTFKLIGRLEVSNTTQLFMFNETGRRCLGVGMVIEMFRVSANPLECWFSLDVFSSLRCACWIVLACCTLTLVMVVPPWISIQSISEN